MNKPNLDDLKNAYDDIPLPPQLDAVVQNALENQRRLLKMEQKKRSKKRIMMITGTAAAAVCLFVGSINVSPALAGTLADIPGLGGLVEVCSFRNYSHHEKTYQADVQVPQVKNGLDQNIEATLNEKYLAEGKALYDQFMTEVDQMKAEGKGDGHLGVDSGYEIKTDNASVFAIARYVVNTVGSSSTTMTFDTVDKKKQLIVTLPSLFKDGADYVTPISDNIKAQMTAQMKADENKAYWLNDELAGDANFEKIKGDQNFYINNDGKLVICFDKYDVAPGYMGTVEFVIPTDVVQSIILNRGLLK